MINSDDVVTRAGKFLVLYKRPGLRVLINQLGDMVVRPNYVESVIRRVPGGALPCCCGRSWRPGACTPPQRFPIRQAAVS